MSTGLTPDVRARAYRLVCAVLSDDGKSSRYKDAQQAVNDMLREIGMECENCADTVYIMAELADFVASLIRRSSNREEWDRWLTNRIASLLDAASQGEK